MILITHKTYIYIHYFITQLSRVHPHPILGVYTGANLELIFSGCKNSIIGKRGIKDKTSWVHNNIKPSHLADFCEFSHAILLVLIKLWGHLPP